MKLPVRAVLFDLGGTLIYPRQPWGPVLQRGYQAMADVLCTHGVSLDCHQLASAIPYHLERYFARRQQDLIETTYLVVLGQLLADYGHPQVEPGLLRQALDAFFALTQANWTLEEDTLPTLNALKTAGYHLGIASNAGDHQDVLQLVHRFGLEPWFDFVLTSAMCSYRKPHPRLFELALERWNLPAHQVVMVGDSLEADIYGAQQVGLFAIWIRRRAGTTSTTFLIRPEAEIQTLAELPSLLDTLQRDDPAAAG